MSGDPTSSLRPVAEFGRIYARSAKRRDKAPRAHPTLATRWGYIE
jgi:hypothetical protein